jgi:hypothetical protein
MKRSFIALILAAMLTLPVSTFGQAAAAKAKSPARKAAEAITQQQLKDYLYFVASDEMEGRDTPSRGLDLTAKFIGMQLSRWGFTPAGDNGTFYQTIELDRTVVAPAGTTVRIGGKDLVYGTDVIANPAAGTIDNAPLVFAGNGWFIKQRNLDPLKDQDVKGKVMVVYGETLPRGVKSYQELFALGRQGKDWMNPSTYAQEKGAAGLIIINAPGIQKNWERLRNTRERGQYGIEKLEARKAGTFPVVYLSQSAGEALLTGESASLAKIAETYDSPTGAMPVFNFSAEKTSSIKVATNRETVPTQNVVAKFEGSDPVLKNEMVAIGAHYDHVGMNPNLPGPDKIFNGADDDGSGTVAVLSIAEALAKSAKRPKRSVLFVWHCGEEKGLWGSEYFNKFPTVDIKNVVAQLNIDMIGRSRKADDTKKENKELSGENGVYVIGAEMMSSTLGSVVKGINSAYLNLGYDYRYDDPKDPNRFFFRSDHFNYAHNGIPITFWFDGVHEDYHGVGDEPQKIDYAKMEKIARTIFLTMWEVGDLKERPKVDKQLPKELTEGR